MLLALCLVLSLGAFASGEASGAAGSFAQVDDTHWSGSSVTIRSVEYAPEFTGQGYVDSTLFTGVAKIVTDAGTIDVDSAVYTPVLTVDGVQVDLYNAANETFTGDVVLTLVEKGDSNANKGAPFGADKAQSSFGPFYYTAAAYVADGAYDAAKSAGAAQISGDVTDNGIFDQVGSFADIVGEKLGAYKLPILFATGNHDMLSNGMFATTKRELYDEAYAADIDTGATATASRHSVVGGVHFIQVSATSYRTGSQNYTAKTMDWLRNSLELAAKDAPGMPIFVSTHLPVYDTVFGSDAYFDAYSDFYAKSDAYSDGYTVTDPDA